MTKENHKKLFKITATTVILADSVEHVSNALADNNADIWAFEDSAIEEVRSLSDLPDGWAQYSCPAVADKVYTADPWANAAIVSLLEAAAIVPKPTEERITELEKEVESLKQLLKRHALTSL
jgi:hypothetical protein